MTTLGDDPRVSQILSELRALLTVAERTAWTRSEALAIVETLRIGVPPATGALALTVGREAMLAHLSQDLIRVGDGKPRLIFVVGDYGTGKTHILRVLQEYAQRHSFATALVELSRRECPLHDLSLLYQKVVQNLEVRLDGAASNLESLLSHWASRIRHLAQHDRPAALSRLTLLHHDLQAALTSYFCEEAGASSLRTRRSIEWLMGATLSARERAAIGVSSDICERNAIQLLGSLGLMMREAGLQGMVLLLDEVDPTLSFAQPSHGVRAARNLRSLIRSVGSFPHCCILYSVPPTFFGHAGPTAGLGLSPDTLVELQPLGVADLVTLARKIRDLHLIGYAWEDAWRVRDSEIRGLATSLLEDQSLRSSVRAFVRAIVGVLDVCQEHREQTATSVAKALAQSPTLARLHGP